MEDYSVFWIIPILTLIMTWFGLGLASLARESEYPFACIPAIIGVILWHLMMFYNRDSLHSIFHGGTQHIGYYQALELYGEPIHRLFNYGLLGIQVLFFISVCLHCLGIIKIDQKDKDEQGESGICDS